MTAESTFDAGDRAVAGHAQPGVEPEIYTSTADGEPLRLRRNPLPFPARHRSHADEIDELMGKDDRSFVDLVRQNFYEQEAGRHLAGRIGALSLQGDFTPNAVLDQVMREYDWLLNGNQLPVPGGVA